MDADTIASANTMTLPHHQPLQDTNSVSAAAIHARLADLAWAYIRSKDTASLSSLQSALARISAAECVSSSSGLFLEQQHQQQSTQESPATQLANTLAFSLEQPSSEMKLLAARVLTNLAANTAKNTTTTTTTTVTTKPNGTRTAAQGRTPGSIHDSSYVDDNIMEDDSDDANKNYYGWQPEGWCDIIIHSKALTALVQLLHTIATPSYDSAATYSTVDRQVCQQVCWALGNICGDSPQARQAAYAQGVMTPLVHSLQHGLQWNSTEICRNAAWAIVNLTRGGYDAPQAAAAIPTISYQQALSPISPCLLSHVMMAPETQKYDSKKTSQTSSNITWWEVGFEGCWILTFLTASRDETVQALLESKKTTMTSQPFSQVCQALASRLETGTKIVRVADSVDGFERALKMCIPCLRAVGNIATACQGAHIPALLQARDGSIVKSLATLIELGTFPCASNNNSTHSNNSGDISSVALEAAWAAGSLLCDAGLPDHLSSTLACPTLLPILCRTITCGYSKLDLKREAMSALWNAISAPPGQDVQDMGHQWSSRPLRNEFCTSASFVESFVNATTELLTCFVDADAVYYAIQVMNAMLRHSANPDIVQRQFQEAGGVDALEAICDCASQSYNNNNNGSMVTPPSSAVVEQSANIAADLIDDLFDDDEAEIMALSSPERNTEGQFGFGVVATGAPQVFDFSNNNGASQEQPMNPDIFHSHVPSVAPMGRGRGKPTPAWMQQENSAPLGLHATTSTFKKPASSYPW